MHHENYETCSTAALEIITVLTFLDLVITKTVIKAIINNQIYQ